MKPNLDLPKWKYIGTNYPPQDYLSPAIKQRILTSSDCADIADELADAIYSIEHTADIRKEFPKSIRRIDKVIKFLRGDEHGSED